MKTLVNKNNPAIRITAPEIESSYGKFYTLPDKDFHHLFKMETWTLVEEEPEVELEQAADVSANEVYPPMIEVYPRIPNSTSNQKVIDRNAYNRMLHIEGFKAGAEWQKENHSYEKIKRCLAISFMHYLDEIRPEGKMCLSNGECADIDKAFDEMDWDKLARYLEKYRKNTEI